MTTSIPTPPSRAVARLLYDNGYLDLAIDMLLSLSEASVDPSISSARETLSANRHAKAFLALDKALRKREAKRPLSVALTVGFVLLVFIGLFVLWPRPKDQTFGALGGRLTVSRCRADEQMVGIRISYSGLYLASAKVICQDDKGKEHLLKTFGRETSPSHELRCAKGTTPVGIEGRAQNLVTKVGLICSDNKVISPVKRRQYGHRFKTTCLHEDLRGLRLMHGALIDAIGIACESR